MQCYVVMFGLCGTTIYLMRIRNAVRTRNINIHLSSWGVVFLRMCKLNFLRIIGHSPQKKEKTHIRKIKIKRKTKLRIETQFSSIQRQEKDNITSAVSALEDNKTNLVCFLLLAQTRQNIDTGGNYRHMAGSYLNKREVLILVSLNQILLCFWPALTN